MIVIKDLGLEKYNEVWSYQKKWLNDSILSKQEGQKVAEELIFVEHPHVYTFGKHADTSNLLVNQTFLNQIKAETFQIERGGDITYHGPGQLVVYPLLDLEQHKMGIKKYIFKLEQVIIDTISEYGIIADRIEGRTGIWLDKDEPAERKIAAIGIKSSRYLTIHGLAFNINTDLSYFNHIIPCGIQDKGVTSLAQEIGKSVSMPIIIEQFKTHFKRYFQL
jgi:lipoyl(octanoyl) transferase